MSLPDARVVEILEDCRARDQACIAAIQRRLARHALRDLLWRRPWRSPSRPDWRRPGDVLGWLRAAHDCADPSVACSCSGGFRFPRLGDGP